MNTLLYISYIWTAVALSAAAIQGAPYLIALIVWVLIVFILFEVV